MSYIPALGLHQRHSLYTHSIKSTGNVHADELTVTNVAETKDNLDVGSGDAAVTITGGNGITVTDGALNFGGTADVALTNDTVTLSAGSGISITDSAVALGGSTTIALTSDTVTLTAGDGISISDSTVALGGSTTISVDDTSISLSGISDSTLSLGSTSSLVFETTVAGSGLSLSADKTVMSLTNNTIPLSGISEDTLTLGSTSELTFKSSVAGSGLNLSGNVLKLDIDTSDFKFTSGTLGLYHNAIATSAGTGLSATNPVALGGTMNLALTNAYAIHGQVKMMGTTPCIFIRPNEFLPDNDLETTDADPHSHTVTGSSTDTDWHNHDLQWIGASDTNSQGPVGGLTNLTTASKHFLATVGPFPAGYGPDDVVVNVSSYGSSSTSQTKTLNLYWKQLGSTTTSGSSFVSGDTSTPLEVPDTLDDNWHGTNKDERCLVVRVTVGDDELINGGWVTLRSV